MKIPGKKKKYVVEFFGECEGKYRTMAVDERSALNNACYQLAEDVDQEVSLVRWKVNEGRIEYDIEEDEKEGW